MRTALRGSRRSRALVLLTGLALVTVVVGGIAWAAIPQDGVYTGCFMKSGGTLRIIDAAQKCKSSETRITWNQQGPQGIQGEQGPQGIQGEQGPQGLPGSGGAVLVQRDVYQTTPSNPLHLAVGVPTLLSTVQKPDSGTAGSPWNKALVTASVNIGNQGSARGFVWCQFADASGTGFTVEANGINTATLATGYQSTDPNVELRCTSNTETADIWVGWVDIAVIPAGSVVTKPHG